MVASAAMCAMNSRLAADDWEYFQERCALIRKIIF
jgi:hypothetical protein